MEFNYSKAILKAPTDLIDVNNNNECVPTNNSYTHGSASTSNDILSQVDYNYSYMHQGHHIEQQQPKQRGHVIYNVTGLASVSKNFQYSARNSCSTSHNYQRNRYMPYNCSVDPYQHILPSLTRSSYLHTPTALPLPAPPAVYQSCPTSWVTPLNFLAPLPTLMVQKSHKQQQQPQQQLQHSTLLISKAITSNTTTTNILSTSASTTNNYKTAYIKHNSTLNVSTTLHCTNKSFNTTSAIQTPTIASSVTGTKGNKSTANVFDTNDTITLQISNLDHTMDEANLKSYLVNQLKPITPVISITIDGSSYAKVTVPNLYFAKKVVSNLHRKKMGHKRILVSYTKDSSLTEFQTLRCQVAGLLKDVPNYTLPMYKFRELFQCRFKTTISVLDLYKMPDICTIHVDNNEDKFISLKNDLMDTLETSNLAEDLHNSVPYCMIHFKREQHKGWAEQEIEPLPSVFMTIKEIQEILYSLMKNHAGDIPVSSLVHCIEAELNIRIHSNENGVNLEHLICCVHGIQIRLNNFGIKILSWIDSNVNKDNGKKSSMSSIDINGSTNNLASANDSLHQISREIIELVKMSPKATMKFSRFIPAYHNHFGTQCRVADYGYTKLIELFEALSTVIQIMGDGDNRQITLTHRIQVRRFTSDLLRILRASGNRSILLSELPTVFSQIHNRKFDITDYGVCDITDILDNIANSNIIIITPISKGNDILVSMPKRKQTPNELVMISIFAGEVVELFSTAPQYTVSFQKFGRSYQYHFGVQCRLSDYGFLKLADLIDAIQGVVEMEIINDEDKKIYLSKKVAQRVFAKQCEELILEVTGSSNTCMQLQEVLNLHKKKFGYQMQPQTLGGSDIEQCMTLLPYVEVLQKKDGMWIICHNENKEFRTQCYKACKLLLSYNESTSEEENNTQTSCPSTSVLPLNDFISAFNEYHTETLSETKFSAMKYLIEVKTINDCSYVCLSDFMKFIINIVRLLEENVSMKLYKIKDILNCTLSKVSEYGFPNLYTIITSYPEIFRVNVSTTEERAVISLVKNAELCTDLNDNRKPLYGSLKMPCIKHKPSRDIPQELFTENNERSDNNFNESVMSITTATSYQKRPEATNILSNDLTYMRGVLIRNNNPNVKMLNTYDLYNNTKTNIALNNGMHDTMSRLCFKSAHNSKINCCLPCDNKENRETIYQPCTTFNISNQSLSSDFPEYNNINNDPCSVSFSSLSSVPTQFQGLNQTSEKSDFINNSIALLNAKHSNNVNPTKLWDRRQNLSYYQQHMPLTLPNQKHIHPNLPLPLNDMPIPSVTRTVDSRITLNISNTKDFNLSAATSSSGYNELVHNMLMYSMYEPPKPDTPRSDNMPFWIDPTWSNYNNHDYLASLNNESLNIRLPELSSMNLKPLVMSPYSLSKIEKMKYFNFDSHDRKIA